MGQGTGQKESAAALEAAAAFMAGEYARSLSVLRMLRDRASTDPKVLHNLALTEYYASSKSNPHELLEKLASLKTLCEQQASSSSAPQSPSSAPLSDSGLSSNATQSGQADGSGHSLLIVNLAAVHIQLGQHSKAAALLEPLYSKIDPLQERTALRVCQLLLECSLSLGRRKQAEGVVAYMQRAFGEAAVAGASGDGQGAAPSPTAACQQSGTSGLPPVAAAVHMAKARLDLAERRLGNAEAEAAKAEAFAPGNHQVSFFRRILGAHMRQVGGDPEGAAEELAALLSGTPSERSSERLLLLGNLGALHHHLGKHNAALMYYGQAIRAGGPGVAEGQVAILRYGAALQLMQTGRPWEASSLLLAVAAIYYDSPLLWLRLAECHIHSTRCCAPATVEAISGKAASGSTVTGLILPGGRVSTSEEPCDAGQQGGSLAKAAQYLTNALFLLGCQDDAAGKASGDLAEGQATSAGAQGLAAPPESSASGNALQDLPSCPLEPVEHQVIRMAVLANLAYVSLAQSNPVVALTQAEDLLAVPGCSQTHRHLGNCYAAEALCMLGRPAEAAEHLNSSINDEAVAERDRGDDGDQTNGSGGSSGHASLLRFLRGSRASAMLNVNLASVHAMQGNLSKAYGCAAAALRSDPNCRAAHLMNAYLKLVQGCDAEALQFIRRQSACLMAASGKAETGS